MAARRRGGSIQQQGRNGRFVRNTTENTFGLRVIACPACGALNPYARKAPVETNGFIDPFSVNQWDVPTHCHGCHAPLPSEQA